MPREEGSGPVNAVILLCANQRAVQRSAKVLAERVQMAIKLFSSVSVAFEIGSYCSDESILFAKALLLRRRIA